MEEKDKYSETDRTVCYAHVDSGGGMVLSMILKELTYGIPKEDTYKSAIFMPIDELEEEFNYWKNVIQINESRWNLMVLVKEILVMNNTWDLNTIITIYHTFEGEVVVLRRDTVYDLIQYRYPELEYPVKFFTEESIKVCLP
jgi:hypothetical protein